MKPLVLEPAQEDDLGALVDLERRCFTHPWTPRGFRTAMSHPDRGRLVVLRGPFEPRDPGRGIAAYSAYEVVLDELHIQTLAVHPLHRRGGLGRQLLGIVLELGARRGAAVALLEVRRSNWAALELYRSFGFSQVASRKDYYEDPREDALLLEKRDLPNGAPWK